MAMLALKPPMGWNAWNQFGPAWINETVVRETADAIVERGSVTPATRWCPSTTAG